MITTSGRRGGIQRHGGGLRGDPGPGKFFHLPESGPGWTAAALWMGSILFFAGFFAFVAAGEKGGDTFFSGSPWLPAMILPAFGVGIAGGAVAAWAVAKLRDLSALVFVPLVWGILMLAWTIAEFAFPH